VTLRSRGSAARPATLAGWLRYLETLHPNAIALGLDRVREVQERLALQVRGPVITVGGTNGKGSTCAMLERILRSAGYRTGLYASPHLLRYNERARLSGEEVDDGAWLAAFEAVEDARERHAPVIPLTYFEFGTLAALWLFARARPDVLVLEVGLGGRLDAVNAVDADVAIVTGVGIDHVEFLGGTRDAIGREKAGIFRHGRPAICGDPDPPLALVQAACALGAELLVLGRDFGPAPGQRQWDYWGPGGARRGLPIPALRGAYQLGNAACALAALDTLKQRLPVSANAVREGLVSVELPGRFQVLPGRPTIVLDVAHNPQAAAALADTLGSMGFHRETSAVLGMLRDKDIAGVVAAMMPRIDHWCVAPLEGPRGASADALRAALSDAGVAGNAVTVHADVPAALAAARGRASDADRIVVFGSFLTVAAATEALHPASSLSLHG
jgi:dihydrofolate synthase / folylpolyglutamate synthase